LARIQVWLANSGVFELASQAALERYDLARKQSFNAWQDLFAGLLDPERFDFNGGRAACCPKRAVYDASLTNHL
jgi:hypothetical protein